MAADQSARRVCSSWGKAVITAPGSPKKARYGDRHAYWEDLFREPDPWNYGSSYEQEKYARQITLLPDRPIGKALELACAEGRFTVKLAPHVERLIATDISSTALQRARDRCCSHENIEFRQLDLAIDPLPEELDLIVCSEVLYYLDSEAELERVAKRLTAALKPGGHILTAHAFVLKDDLSRTCFDWDNPWGTKTIARVFSAVPGLALERSLCTELYRIDRFVHLEEGQPSCDPTIETLPITAQIEIEVARHILWGGAMARRTDLAATERHQRVPVLLYHRIADDGPVGLARYRLSSEMFRAQMRWLRRNGYHTIVSEELAWFLANNHPFVGRPVMISFDDGFQDFADQAWPILRIHDFRAEVFVVTDLVGQTAQWDAHLGEPAPLMGAPTIVRLAAEGVSFGSHLATHRGADGLATRELAEELTRSRAMLGQWLDHPVQSFAAPFGLTDERLRLLAAECGFRTGFSTEPGVARLTSDPLNLPRIEIRGDLTLEDFVTRLESCR
jgi:peptidoglycan/xylan/chitin deacetylase (PgdA/CDA1 family)/ubiquinone/menaquinone biosynthesis C-methylase UbiE